MDRTPSVIWPMGQFVSRFRALEKTELQSMLYFVTKSWLSVLSFIDVLFWSVQAILSHLYTNKEQGANLGQSNIKLPRNFSGKTWRVCPSLWIQKTFLLSNSLTLVAVFIKWFSSKSKKVFRGSLVGLLWIITVGRCLIYVGRCLSTKHWCFWKCYEKRTVMNLVLNADLLVRHKFNL